MSVARVTAGSISREKLAESNKKVFFSFTSLIQTQIYEADLCPKKEGIMKKPYKYHLLALGFGIVLLCFLLSNLAEGSTLFVTEYRVTSTTLYETTPTLGNDGSGDLVVYTARELLITGFFDQGDIWYQRLVDGAPSGLPVQVTSDLTDDQLNDVSGDYIVYTAYDSVAVSSGTIMLYQISTCILQPIGDALVIQEPRIHGSKVVWTQGGFGASEVMIYDLTWIGTAQVAQPLTGPVPPTFNVDIGDRYVVWVEQDGDTDIGAYDLDTDTRLLLTDTPGIDDRHPSTFGDWIVWESQDFGATDKRIEAINLVTGDYRIIIDDGSAASRPSIDGDLIAYETDSKGNFDVYVYRISTGETFQVTSHSDDQYLNDVFGDLVAYVDMRTDDKDIYVACLNWPPPTIWSVKTDGSDSNIGTSWDDSFQTIQKAIDESTDGDEIWLKHGTYVLSSQIDVDEAVGIYGGFAGTETEIDQRDWENNVTTVDGQDLAYHCFFVTANATIDGLTITGGNASSAPWPYDAGGGIYIDDSSLVITNCTIYDNKAHFGGGIYINFHSSATIITNCTFSGNNGYNDGGGIFNQGILIIANCTFSDNYTEGEVGGGGISNDGELTATNCTFSGNIASYGGGIENHGSSTITNCTFSGNSAEFAGGGISNRNSSSTITNCTFFGNCASDSGGGIYNEYSSPTITNCILLEDTALFGPEILNYSNSSPTIAYCDIDQDGYEGINGNIRKDPLFVDPANGDFHLWVGSPCIDSGTNTALAIPYFDFEGDPRILDGDNDGNAIVDMGADEYVWTEDNDTDGVPNYEEMGPDGNNPDYDGNFDSIPDSQQSNVASFHTYDGRSYVTLASPYGTTLTNVQAVDNPSPADAPFGVDFPYGFVEFTIDGIGPGGATTVTFYLPEAAPATYYKYGPTPDDSSNHWYEFIYDAPTQTGAAPSGNTITLYFVDGQRGDKDLTANGTIVEPGGPGLLPFIPVAIDIKPFSRRNIIILRKWGLISVVILSTDGFDAPREVDRTSLTFGRTGDEESLAYCRRWAIDVNRDRRRDLVCYFWTGKTGFKVGDTEGFLKGQTKDGVTIEGSDSVKIVKWRWWW